MIPRAGARIHVLYRKEDLEGFRLAGKVVIVLDILFATSTIVSALAHGATDVIPTLDEWGARAKAAELPENSFVASGELYAETIEGFVSPTPLALIAHGVSGRTLVYSTTNGTVALRQASAAAYVYAGALLNAQAVVDLVRSQHPDETVLIVCSGSAGSVNLEDMVGAGCFVDLFAQALGSDEELTDAAIAALHLYRSVDPFDALMRSRVGRMMQERDLVHEVEFASRRSQIRLVPRLVDGRLVAVQA